MKTILHTVDINATLTQVFQALATENGLKGWWTTKVKADIRVGGIVDFTFGKTFNPDMKITALEDPKVVAWKCVGGHAPWTDNTFRFAIESRGEGCVLFFRHEYARELNDEEYGRYNYNWGYYLDSLRLLVETGRGKPYLAPTPAQKKAVVERFVEEYKNRHNPNIVDELVAEDCKVHLPLPGLPPGREGMRINGQMMCGAFPDVRVEREFFLVDGDIVVERAKAAATHEGDLMGMLPTGKKVTWTELHAYRVEAGQIIEVWSEADFMGVMVQLGAVKMPGS
ncbi:ester cyclase [candidate division KSB1 bacterium]|nr:ester cyclase [candidate division KSB1 bacterium]